MIPFNSGNGVSGVVHEDISFDDIESQQQRQMMESSSGEQKERRSHRLPQPQIVVHTTSQLERFLVIFLVTGTLFILFLNYVMYAKLQPHGPTLLPEKLHHDRGNVVPTVPKKWLADHQNQKQQKTNYIQDFLGLDGIV